MRFKTLVLATLAGAAACSNPVGPASEAATVNLRYEATGPLADVGLLTFRLSNGGWRRTVLGRELNYQGPGYWWTNRAVPVASPGTLNVDVMLRRGSDTLAVGHLPFGVLRRWDYSLQVYVGRGDPRTFGWVVCVPDIQAFPVRVTDAGADSVYVAWGGVPRGAVC